jgi:hypothetical protein
LHPAYGWLAGQKAERVAAHGTNRQREGVNPEEA